MTDYSAAFQRPFQDLKKLTIGAILNGIPFVNIVTSIIVTGYTAECARLTLKKNNNLPVWEMWGSLLKKGFLMMVIWGVYSIPLFLSILLLFFDNFEALLVMDPKDFLAELVSHNWGAVLAVVAISIATWYFTFLAIIHYVANDRFKEAFAWQLIFSRALTVPYVKAWVVAFVYTGLTGVILQALLLTLPPESVLIGLVYNLFSGYLTCVTAITSITLGTNAYIEIVKRRH